MQLEDWADTNRLSEWVQESTATLLGLVADFDDSDRRWIGPYLDVVNPPIWEIAHAAWFAEWFVCRELHGRDPVMADADSRYDSAKIEHTSRWNLSYPSPGETKDYVRRVADSLCECLANDRGIDSTNHFVAYAITHYDAHCEALSYTRQTLEWGEPPTIALTALATDTPVGHSIDGDIKVIGAEMLLGAARSQPLIMDNEKWAHRVQVTDFALARTPVTVRQFADFVAAGGYSTETLWSTEGWAWRNKAAADHPVYWRHGVDGWELREMTRWLPVETRSDHPMTHVSWHEAQAWCRWAGRRLPTESEWEYAATTGPDGMREPWFPWGDRDPELSEANLDGNHATTAPVGAFSAGDGPWGHRQMIGNVWEWTSSTFQPYPHFEPDAYRDNSEPWFGSRKVLKGGSFATRNRYVRSTFRNFFTPDRRDVYAGFRTCAR